MNMWCAQTKNPKTAMATEENATATLTDESTVKAGTAPEAEEESDPVVKEMIHDQSFGTPQLDSWGQPKEPLGSQVA